MDSKQAAKVMSEGVWWDFLDEDKLATDENAFEEFHDAIDQAVATLDQYRWISVKEKLPPPGETVIVLIGGMVAKGRFSEVGVWYLNLTKKTLFEELDEYTTTHWMPMPPLEGS